VLQRITRTYNADGNKITEKKFFLHHNENKMIQETSFEFTYRENGKIASKKGWEDGKEDKIVTYKYKHEENSETISKYSATNSLLEQWITKTDENGRLLADIHSLHTTGQAAVTKTIEFTYDKYDHILVETLSKSNSTVKMQILFEYSYDQFGNWIERKEKKIKGVKETEGNHLIRTIEYYDVDEYGHPPMEMDESYSWEMRDDKRIKIFEESHVRINNNMGELEWVVRRNGQDLFQVDEYEYEDGSLIRINHLNHEKEQKAYTLGTFDEKGLTTEIATYSFDGKINERSLFEYDGKDRLIKQEDQFSGPNHGPLKTEIVEEFKYDDGIDKVIKSNLVEYGSKYVVEYEYDDGGNLVKEILTPGSKDEEVITTSYIYENGNLVLEVEVEGKSKVPSDEAKYEYDDRGAVIRSTHYRDGKLHAEIDYVYFE
ncbi:hypothetical protein JYT72_01845, partial [Crocinitomix catalasitica]|nr:hypothetical protein [Crocinitomix catalasitica]